MRNYCYIVRDKQTKEEHLIPTCWDAAIYTGELSSREIIREYCTCKRGSKKEFKNGENDVDKDYILQRLNELEGKYQKQKHELDLLKEELDSVRDTFMLEIVDLDE